MSIIFDFNQRKRINGVKYPYPIEEEKMVIGSVGSDEVKTEYLVPTMRLQRDNYKYPIKYNPIKSLKGFIESISEFYDSYPDLKGKIGNQEVFGAIYVDRQNRPLGITYLGIGSIVGVVADPKLIMSPLILLNASSVFCFHNHPSGTMEFSPQDKSLCKKIAQSCNALDVTLTDFVVISPSILTQYPLRGANYYSALEDEPNLLKP
jgi:DNA repair protein RadC